MDKESLDKYDFFIKPWSLFTFISSPNVSPQILSPSLIEGPWIEDPHSEILNEKKKIESFVNQDLWEIRKKIINPYELIFSSIDSKFPGMSLKIPLSRSYFKMIEMLSFCDFWNHIQHLPSIQTAHVCEGPGGFIQCLLEGAKDRSIHVSSVFAMTLRPVKAHIPGWRRSHSFLKKFPQISLEYGDDNTGNILIESNQNSFIKKTNQSISLFTADGGFDFSTNYESQEQTVYPLLLSSFIIGLSCLAPHGVMIIKLFDMYSQATRDLIFGSSSFFAKWTIYKPATSRPFNSERYFIGVDFLGNATSWILFLKSCLNKPVQRLFSHPIPSPIAQCLSEQISWQESLQMYMIQNSLHLSKDNILPLIDSHIHISKNWCNTFSVPTVQII